jgi:SM-20-related protein
MEVRVKLLLRGGYGWEFCCKDVPVADPLKFVGTKRLAAPSDSFPPGASVPSPFVLASNALPDDVHAGLIAHVLSQDLAAMASWSGMCELNLVALEEPVLEALRSRMAHRGSIIGIPDQTEIELEFCLFAIGDTQTVSWDQNPADILHMMYHFHKQPKGFTGGGVRLFDGRIENRPTASFRDVEIGDNNLPIFPENVVSAGLPVRCPTRSFAEGLFGIRGSLR